MRDFTFCEAWPQELKDAEAARYRAYMKVRCLENNVEQADYSEFDYLMDELEEANRELQAASVVKTKLCYAYASKDNPLDKKTDNKSLQVIGVAANA